MLPKTLKLQYAYNISPHHSDKSLYFSILADTLAFRPLVPCVCWPLPSNAELKPPLLLNDENMNLYTMVLRNTLRK